VEPIASSAAASIRPGGGGGPELASLLKDGRVLRAEVLEPNTGGSLLLAVARHTVPADTDLQLDPGTRLLVRVEETAEGVVLRLLAPEAGPEDALAAALRARVGRTPPLGELLGELASLLRRGGAPGTGPLAALLATLEPRLAGPGPGAEGLARWLAQLGLGHEAGLASLAGGAEGRARPDALRASTKALLLQALGLLADAEAGPELREGVARALAGLETEQLLHLARERSGEPVVLAFPVPDGEGTTTARLLVARPRTRPDGEAADPTESARVALGLELSRLGPVRADLVLAPASLHVHVLVTRSAVARRLEEELATLAERLGDGRMGVHLRVRLGTPEEARRGFLPADVRFLREHQWMNVAG